MQNPASGSQEANFSDTTASPGASDDEGSTAATDGSTLRTSPAEQVTTLPALALIYIYIYIVIVMKVDINSKLSVLKNQVLHKWLVKAMFVSFVLWGNAEA